MAAVDNAYIEKLFVAAKLSETERDVLVYLINHIEVIDELNIRDVASACFTSTTTVIRLAKKLGYRGWSEMAIELKGLTAPAQNVFSVQDGDRRSAVRDVVCTQQDIDTFHELLARPGIICLYGEGYSSLVMEYIEKKLIIGGHHTVNHNLLGTNTLLKQISDISFGFFISKGGSTVSVNEAARRCKHQDIPVVCLTGNPRSKLASYADARFVIHDDDPFDTEIRGCNLFFARCIAAFELLLANKLLV